MPVTKCPGTNKYRAYPGGPCLSKEAAERQLMAINISQQQKGQSEENFDLEQFLMVTPMEELVNILSMGPMTKTEQASVILKAKRIKEDAR